MDTQFGNLNYLYLLAFAFAGLGLLAWAFWARRTAFHKLGTQDTVLKMLPIGSGTRFFISGLLTVVCMALVAVAMVDIRWGKMWEDVPQKGIEVMFVLDVSRSMLAEDTTPNRLDRAKQQIKDMIDEMAGDRIGLVIFAGETRQSVPLTSHYDSFKQVLDSVSPDSLRRGGSRLGDAIQAGADGFINKTNDNKAIVVFTDGEDQESRPIEIAQRLHEEKGIRVFTIGLGDVTQGARIPDAESRRRDYIEYQGQQVWSKLNGEILSQIATQTNGAYVPAGTKRVNMADVYHGYVANVEEKEFESARINKYIPRFQWFAGPALFLLIFEVWYSTRSFRPRKNLQSTTSLRDASGSQSDINNPSINQVA